MRGVEDLLKLVEKWNKDRERTGEWHGEDAAFEEGQMVGREECADELDAAIRRLREQQLG